MVLYVELGYQSMVWPGLWGTHFNELDQVDSYLMY